MPIVFLLVTDIDVNKNGIDNFNYNLNALTSTSTVTYSEYITNPAKHSILKSTSSMIIYVARILMSI